MQPVLAAGGMAEAERRIRSLEEQLRKVARARRIASAFPSVARRVCPLSPQAGRNGTRADCLARRRAARAYASGRAVVCLRACNRCRVGLGCWRQAKERAESLERQAEASAVRLRGVRSRQPKPFTPPSPLRTRRAHAARARMPHARACRTRACRTNAMHAATLCARAVRRAVTPAPATCPNKVSALVGRSVRPVPAAERVHAVRCGVAYCGTG
jgi:hypothetical protein